MNLLEAIHSSGFALTPMQSSFVLDSNYVGSPWVNLEQVVLHLEDSELTAASLAHAWSMVASVHESLRTSILWRDQIKPFQFVADRIEPIVDVIDWQDRAEDHVADLFETFLAEDRKKGVELEASPPWRVTLVLKPGRRSAMVWTMHHALTDGTSIGLILEDVWSYLQTGSLISDVDQTGSYRDLCGVIQNGAGKDGQAFFADYLHGFEPRSYLLPVSGGHAHEERTQPTRKAVCRRFVDPKVADDLTSRTKELGVTLNTLFQAAWGIVLARQSNESDVVFGCVRSGRRPIDAPSRATGCLINTIPMRIRLQAGDTLGSLVRQVRQDTLDMHPLEQVSVGEVRNAADLHTTTPLFDTVLMFDHESPDTRLQNSHLDTRGLRVDLREEGSVPLTLAVYEGERLQIDFEYCPDKLDPTDADRLADYVVTLIGSMSRANAQTLVGSLDMLSAGDQTALIALGQPDMPVTNAPDVIARFSTVAAAQPNLLAIEDCDGQTAMSFAELEARAIQLAAALQRHGAGPGGIVAICLERSPDFIVSLLAVLKTGAAFLPIDPGYPVDLIDHMLQDSQVQIVVSMTDVEGRMVIRPDATAPLSQMPSRSPSDMAYLIYTSGSTGKPKGVMVSNAALSSHVEAMVRAFALTPEDRVLQFAALSFDVAIEEILPTLLAGATVVLRGAQSAHSTPDFLAEIRDRDLTVMNLPTGFWHILTEYLHEYELSLPDSLRLMITGGERVNAATLRMWQVLAPDVRWLNGYGPTETTITCTLFEPEAGRTYGEVPIGRATDHAFVYVVGPDGSLSPKGAVGELWIGGPAVSMGYLNKPAQTEQRFLADPFQPAGRVYCSGDRARWRADGTLEFLGRADRQVKLRGYRIDLMQIESVLEEAQQGLHAVAAVRGENTLGARLLAWVTNPDDHTSVDVLALERAVRSNLPKHMWPQIVDVPEFPTTKGGKIDVAQLPDPVRSFGKQASVAMTPLEEQILGMMSDTLGRDLASQFDDFFAHGGHSLSAAELIGRIEGRLGHKVSIVDLRQDPTAAGLAAAIANGARSPRHIIPIQPNGSRTPIFAIHILGGSESYFAELADELGRDQPVLGVSVGTLSDDLPTAIEDVAKRYCDEIMEFYPDGPVHLMAVSLGSYMALELAHQLQQRGREIGLFVLFDASGPGGRKSRGGIHKVVASLKTVRDRGVLSLPGMFRNRLGDLQNTMITARLKRRKESSGREAAPRTSAEFVASNELAVQAYQPKQADFPILIFRSGENHFDAQETIASGLGWDMVAARGFKVIDTAGGHLSMLDHPHVGGLADHIKKALDKS